MIIFNHYPFRPVLAYLLVIFVGYRCHSLLCEISDINLIVKNATHHTIIPQM